MKYDFRFTDAENEELSNALLALSTDPYSDYAGATWRRGRSR